MMAMSTEKSKFHQDEVENSGDMTRCLACSVNKSQ